MNAGNLDKIQELLEANMLEDQFLVQLYIKPTNNIKAFIDADGGMTIEACIKVNRAVRDILDTEEWYPEGDYSLEVSSPGIDEPLTSVRQYKKNMGRKIQILHTVEADNIITEGILKEVTDENILVHVVSGKGKKMTEEDISFDYNQIEKAVIQVQF